MIRKLLKQPHRLWHDPEGRRGMIAGAVLLVLVAGAGGLLVAASGLIHLNASPGHWSVTRWFLEFSQQRSVSTQALGIEVPPLDDPALMLKGAGHYHIGCRSCHGSPGQRQPVIPQQMLPAPPYLPPEMAEADPAELFHIVKHGLKFTGMPAWPALHRDDEVWAVVAFLKQLPELDAAGYRALVSAEPPQTAPVQEMDAGTRRPDAVTATCSNCHGRGTSAFPRIRGQRREYLANSLRAYAEGRRHSGIMQPIAAALDEATIDELAEYYAGQPAHRRHLPDSDAAAIARGREIAINGKPDQQLPSCVDCHDPAGPDHKPAYPSLAGQPSGYLVTQLELFKEKHRGGSKYHHLMEEVAAHLKPEQMRDVARYFESLEPSAP